MKIDKERLELVQAALRAVEQRAKAAQTVSSLLAECSTWIKLSHSLEWEFEQYINELCQGEEVA